MEDDVKQSSTDRYAVSQAYRWRAERDAARQELEKIKSKQPSMIGNKERREVARRLRELAEEMVEMFRIGAFTGEGIDKSWCRELYDKYARRIREALGVEP